MTSNSNLDNEDMVKIRQAIKSAKKTVASIKNKYPPDCIGLTVYSLVNINDKSRSVDFFVRDLETLIRMSEENVSEIEHWQNLAIYDNNALQKSKGDFLWKNRAERLEQTIFNVLKDVGEAVKNLKDLKGQTATLNEKDIRDIQILLYFYDTIAEQIKV